MKLAADGNRRRVAPASPRPPRGSRCAKPREDVSALAKRLWLLQESPGNVLAGKAAVLGERGAAAVIARAATPTDAVFDTDMDDAARSKLRAQRTRSLRNVMCWMASASSLTSPSSAGDALAHAPDGNDAAMWEDISCSRPVFAAVARALVSLDEAEEALQMLEVVRGDSLGSTAGAAIDGRIPVENCGYGEEKDASTRVEAHWTEDIRLEALAHLGKCEEAQASLRRLESASALRYCVEEEDGGDSEKLVIERYTSAIRACVHCQRSAMSLLRDLESTVMLGNTGPSKKGVATIAKETHELIQHAEAATIDACASTGDWETAFGILRAAQLRSFDSSPKSRWGKKKKPKKRRRRPRPVDTLAVKDGDADDNTHGCVIDELYLSTIRACGAGQAWQRAMSVVREAEHCGVCTPEVYSTAIRALSPSSSENDTTTKEMINADTKQNGASVRERIRDGLVNELKAMSLVWDLDASSSSSL